MAGGIGHRGWPPLFQRRLAAVDMELLAVAPYYGGGFSVGINDEDMLRTLEGLRWRHID